MKSFDSTWETIHARQEWGKYPSEHVIRFVARNYYGVTKRDKIKILDFGCGGGAHTWYIAREGFDTYGFDGSNSAIERVKLRLSKENLYADLRVLDGTELNYEENYFDCIIDNFCIYSNCIMPIKEMYNNVYRILKPNGKFLTAVFSVKTTGFGTGDEIEYHTFRNIETGSLQGRGIAHFFEIPELKEILKQTGFKNLVIDTMEFTDLNSIVSTILVKTEK